MSVKPKHQHLSGCIAAAIFMTCTTAHADYVKGTIALGLDFFDRTCMQARDPRAPEGFKDLIETFHDAGLVLQNTVSYRHEDLDMPISGKLLIDMGIEELVGCGIVVMNVEQSNQDVESGFHDYADNRFDTPMTETPYEGQDKPFAMVYRGFQDDGRRYSIVLEPRYPNDSYFLIALYPSRK